MNFRGFIATGSAALLALGAAGAHAEAKARFVPANFYWVGPYAAGGSGVAGGMLNYLEMLNERDGGINGGSSPGRNARPSTTTRAASSAMSAPSTMALPGRR